MKVDTHCNNSNSKTDSPSPLFYFFFNLELYDKKTWEWLDPYSKVQANVI